MTVDLVPNPEKYEDIYPSDLDSDNTTSDPDSGDDEIDEPQEVKELGAELEGTEKKLKRACEEKASVDWQSKMLEDYAASIRNGRPADLGACIEAYREQRRAVSLLELACQKDIEALTVQHGKQEKAYDKATKGIREQERKRDKEKEIAAKKKYIARQDVQEAKQRLKAERAQFWPKKVYRVILNLDTNPDLTPASSRRSSTSSPTTLTAGQERPSSHPLEISLSLSYITSSAGWTPRYDLSLNTTKHIGLIIYRAEFSNTTSETWKDAKVILSTSQTSFQGLGEPIPKMQPWHVRLLGRKRDDGTTGALRSDHEDTYKRNRQARTAAQKPEDRSVLFGLSGSSARLQERLEASVDAKCEAKEELGENMGSYLDYARYDSYLIGPPPAPPLTEPESSWWESGLTTSYDIPGLRTIAPSNTKRRHRVASVPLREVLFSHIIVPKLRPAAFLKARAHNRSSITLLKGPVGLTLDGSFLGNTTLPRCSAGEKLNLCLGVDPGINVSYAQPVVNRSQGGVFNKDKHAVYTRICTVTNTKSRVIEGVVLDQIPLSEDEHLKIEVLQPAGLNREGQAVRSGAPVTKGGEKWGHARAIMKKDGEVHWEVKVEPGKAVRFVLEYEARFPSGDAMISGGVQGRVDEESDEDMGFGLFD